MARARAGAGRRRAGPAGGAGSRRSRKAAADGRGTTTISRVTATLRAARSPTASSALAQRCRSRAFERGSDGLSSADIMARCAMMRQFELVERVQAYDPDADEELLNRAYVYRHEGARLAEARLGRSLFLPSGRGRRHPHRAASSTPPRSSPALLHDTVEDTDATLDEIERLFGDEIARLVDGVTKLSRLELQSEHTKQAENFRKLVLAMSERHPRAAGQAGRPAAQHAHAALHQGSGQAPAHRARDDGDLRAAGRAHRHASSSRTSSRTSPSPSSIPTPRSRSSHRLQLPARAGRATSSTEIVAELSDDAEGRRASTAEVSGREKTPYSIWRKMQQQERRLRAALRHHGVPRHRRRRRATATGRWASSTARYPMLPRPLQGLHLDAQAERLPLAAHQRHRPAAASASRCRSAPARCTRSPSSASPRTGPTSRATAVDRRPAVPLAARAARHPRACVRARRSSSSTPSSRCSRTRCSASRPRAS